jgi:hypothetical protein
MALSCLATRYQLGIVFQAGGTLSLASKVVALVDGWVAARCAARRGDRSPANRSRNFDGSR